MKKHFFILFSFFQLFPSTYFSQSESIKVITINVWSGTDYSGFWNFGLYEDEETKNFRFEILVEKLKEENADLILIQEANPAEDFLDRLADKLGMEQIHQVCNAGIKFFGLGPPLNFEEGIGILAKPELNLELFDSWKLSGSFGIHGDPATIHFDESTFAIVGKVIYKELPIFVINVHLSASPPLNNNFNESSISELRFSSREEKTEAIENWKENSNRRSEEVKILLEKISELNTQIPVILGGDFNSEISSDELQKIIDTNFFIDTTNSNLITWNPQINQNISYSTKNINASGDSLHGEELISALYDSYPRKIDHLFFSNHFKKNELLNEKLILNEDVSGIFASDHFGLVSEINIGRIFKEGYREKREFTPIEESTWEALPIIMYDTDVGFGYGGKLFFLNQLNSSESIDVILFNSTKGERWYRLVYSYPDFELRQRKVYPFALDIIFDYDKMIKASYFGTSGNSNFDKREYYTKEPFQLSASISRGFTNSITGTFGIKYKNVRNYNFEPQSRLLISENYLNRGRVYYLAMNALVKYDTRNSFINPSKGTVFSAEVEAAKFNFASNVNFIQISSQFQYYRTIFIPKTIFALRISLNGLIGNNLPVQILLPVGGTNTLRGSPQDRYLDKFSSVVNAEFRFPIYWRIGGILAYDFGKVWNSISKFGFSNWTSNPALGLRLYMDTFVVRLDIGVGEETTGFYFNFGHLF